MLCDQDVFYCFCLTEIKLEWSWILNLQDMIWAQLWPALANSISELSVRNSACMLQNQWWNSEFFFLMGWWSLLVEPSNLARERWAYDTYVLNALCLGRKWSIGITSFRALLCCGERELLSGLYPYLGDSPRSWMYSGNFDSRRTWNIKPTPLFCHIWNLSGTTT